MSHESLHDPSAPHDPMREWYVNTIWGKRVDDDNSLFEVMSLQVFQAGLTWKMILDKRDGFRAAFADWDIGTVAAMGPRDVETLRRNPSIIRNRRKIQATIENARTVQELRAKHGSFCTWFYDTLPGNEYPDLQKELRATFSFMGPEISRMWLMAAGRITRDEGDKYRP
ncbi:MAG: DNA-3-methyladenine glycosylase I [Dehalococcoidia bacterium]